MQFSPASNRLVALDRAQVQLRPASEYLHQNADVVQAAASEDANL
ncbi:hypothetical protein [Phormidesmis priestleyi]|nr:hypothetical protein [Phormidesmis priestleyi]